MATKTNFKPEIVKVIKDIANLRPTTAMSVHLASVLSDYVNFEGISDKELLHAFESYRYTLELDISIQHTEDIEDIIRDGMNLDSFSDDEDEENYI